MNITNSDFSIELLHFHKVVLILFIQYMNYFNLTSNAIFYCWSQLAQRFGGSVARISHKNMLMNLSLVYASNKSNSHYESPSIIVMPCKTKFCSQLVLKSLKNLKWLPINSVLPKTIRLPIHTKIPVLFWGEGYEDGSKPFAERLKNGNIVFYADIIASTFFMLSRWEETVSPLVDQHKRFPSTESIAFRLKFLDRPIIDEYALILHSWVRTLIPDWKPQMPRFSVKLSHDIDFLYTASLRRLGGDLLKRQNISLALKTFRYLLFPRLDPSFLACYHLADISEANGFKSAFYFQTSDKSSFDSGYNILTKRAQNLVSELYNRGHEIGFHAGYDTYNDPVKFKKEKKIMDKLLKKSKYGGRQHYLRFRVPDTWRIWEEQGLEYDSTIGYADHEGFRCGTCHPFHPFDIEKDRALNLIEIPLIVMDATLMQYRGLNTQSAQKTILTLASRCKSVNGVFTLLWHNTSLYDESNNWKNLYFDVLCQLRSMCDSQGPR